MGSCPPTRSRASRSPTWRRAARSTTRPRRRTTRPSTPCASSSLPRAGGITPPTTASPTGSTSSRRRGSWHRTGPSRLLPRPRRSRKRARSRSGLSSVALAARGFWLWAPSRRSAAGSSLTRRPRQEPTKGGLGRPSVLRDVERRVQRNAVVEVDHVRHSHADTAVRSGAADRGRVGRAVDPRAVPETHPARLERILRIARRDDRPGEVARPGLLRDVPSGIDRLRPDLIETGGCLEPDPPDGDAVGLDELLLDEIAQLLPAAADRDEEAEALLQLARRYLWTQDACGKLERAHRLRVEQSLLDCGSERRLSHRHTVPRWPDANTGKGGFALALARVRVDHLAHRTDEPLDGFVRVRDVEVETPAQAATGDVAESSGEEVSLPALGQGAGEEPVEVRRELGRGGRKDELATPVEHDDRLRERIADPLGESGSRLGQPHAAHVDARDRDPFRQPVVSRGVVAPRSRGCGSRREHEQPKENDQDFPHGLLKLIRAATPFQRQRFGGED